MVVVRNTERVGSIGSKLYLFIHFIYKTTEMQQPYTSHCHGSATFECCNDSAYKIQIPVLSSHC